MISKLSKIFCASALLTGVVVLAGCGGSDPPTPPPSSPPVTPTHHIGGSVIGLIGGQSAVLSAGSGNTVTIKADGGYTFPVALNEGYLHGDHCYAADNAAVHPEQPERHD